MTDLKADILSRADKDLAAIEQALKDNLTTYLDIVKDVAGHILFSGGKRFRPLLMVLSARACGYRGDYDKTFSVIFEYLHAATLLHDDLVDEATLRRGKPVANTVYGNATAVLVGDFLLARSLTIAAATDRIEVIKAIGSITEDMSQGEIHQLINKGRLNLSEAEYMEVIRRKTAALIEGACRTGALIADGSKKEETALAAYGHHTGMAFQMADDVLDYVSATQELGKEIGADLREGKVTLPVIHALKNASPGERAHIETIVKNEQFTADAFADLVATLDALGGIAYTRKLAEEHVRQARKALSAFPASETVDLLTLLAEYALSRKL
jgi:octaprenyl-diphosphate synthase